MMYLVMLFFLGSAIAAIPDVGWAPFVIMAVLFVMSVMGRGLKL